MPDGPNENAAVDDVCRPLLEVELDWHQSSADDWAVLLVNLTTSERCKVRSKPELAATLRHWLRRPVGRAGEPVNVDGDAAPEKLL